MAKIKILLADGATFTRILLANALTTLGFEVVAVAKNGVEALEMFTQFHPDIALIDLKLDSMGGIDVVRALTKDNPSAAVAMLMPVSEVRDWLAGMGVKIPQGGQVRSN